MPFSTVKDAMESGETLVFGHRGAMRDAPMNTLAAFKLAHQQGAAGIELDVQLAKDGQVVVIHDFTVDATTDGRGAVSGKTLRALQALDAGGWFAPQFAGERIPSLDAVFEAFGRQLLINVEIKSAAAHDAGLERAVAAVIGRHQMQPRVIVSSFDPQALQRFKAALPAVMTGFLHQSRLESGAQTALAALPHAARHPQHQLIDAAYMHWAKQRGHYVNAWTVNDPQRAKTLKKLGVNSLISDSPALIRDAIG